MAKIKVENQLYEKVKEYAEKNGYSSAEEFVSHLLEQMVTAEDAGDLDKDVMERLKGLGYIS
jgi:metal-responsive CopG/Arc/MetJ family transcriptional regulator